MLGARIRSSGEYFVVKAIANGKPGARLGLIAGRRVARRAVDRNRAKRLARVAFLEARLGLPPLDIVFQLKNDMRQARNPEICKELKRLLKAAAARFEAAPAA